MVLCLLILSATSNSQYLRQVSEIMKLRFFYNENDLCSGELGGKKKRKDLAVKGEVSQYILLCSPRQRTL